MKLKSPLIGLLPVLVLASCLVVACRDRSVEVAVTVHSGVTVTISAVVDGSDRFVFTAGSVVYEHGNQRPAQNVIFGGQPWDDLRRSPAAWPALAAGRDLGKARIVSRKGRDVIALEHVPDGFVLWFADTHSGESRYEVTIALPPR